MRDADTATAVDPTDGVTPVNGSFLITYNGSTTAPTQAGSYAVVANFISSDLNYADASITGTLTIGQATPTITISSSYPFYYDTFAQAQYVSEVGVDGVTPVNGTLSVLYNGSSTLPVNAGTYDVSVTFTSNDPNYLTTTADGSMTIQQAGVSLYYYLNGGAYYYIYNGTPQGVNGHRDRVLQRSGQWRLHLRLLRQHRHAAFGPANCRGILHLHRVLHQPRPELRQRRLQLQLCHLWQPRQRSP